MGIFSKSTQAQSRQSEESQKLYGFDESSFRFLAGHKSQPTLEIEIQSIERIIVLRDQQVVERYEVTAAARLGQLTIPCNIQGIEGPLIRFEDLVPPNVVSGWEHIHPRVAATASLDGRFVRDNADDPTYEETRPAINVQLPMNFYLRLMKIHLRSRTEGARFRLRSFSPQFGASPEIKEDWSWQRFHDWSVVQGRSPSSWTVLAESVATWEYRKFDRQR
jgi:hypothetical protein